MSYAVHFMHEADKHALCGLGLPFGVGWWVPIGPNRLRWTWGHRWREL